MPNDAREKRSVVFEYWRDGEMVSLIVPILSIVPIPYINVDTIDIDFSTSISARASDLFPPQEKLVPAASNPTENPAVRRPGIPCPNCRNIIEFSIEDLLTRSTFRCGVCGLELTMNRSASRDALTALEQMRNAIE